MVMTYRIMDTTTNNIHKVHHHHPQVLDQQLLMLQMQGNQVHQHQLKEVRSMQLQEPMHKRHMLDMITVNTTSTMGINMIQTTTIITAITMALQIISNNNRHLKHRHHHHHLLAMMILISNHTTLYHHHLLLHHHHNRSPECLYDRCHLISYQVLLWFFLF